MLVVATGLLIDSAASMARTVKQRDPSGVTGDRRRHALLVAAYELIARKGLEGLRTRDIAARAGVNISTLHYYFGTKSDLIEAVVLFVAAKFAGEGELTRLPPDSTLRAHFERVHSTFEDNPDLSIVLQELALRAQRDATTRAALRPIFKFWNQQVQTVIAAEMKAGRMPSGEQTDELALVVTSFIMGAVTQRGVNARAVDFEALTRRLHRLIVG